MTPETSTEVSPTILLKRKTRLPLSGCSCCLGGCEHLSEGPVPLGPSVGRAGEEAPVPPSAGPEVPREKVGGTPRQCWPTHARWLPALRPSPGAASPSHHTLCQPLGTAPHPLAPCPEQSPMHGVAPSGPGPSEAPGVTVAPAGVSQVQGAAALRARRGGSSAGGSWVWGWGLRWSVTGRD